jgi:hypothetical protein
MKEAIKNVKEFYTGNLYKSLIKKAEKSKYNGFNIPTLSKPELLAVVGDLIDVLSLAEEGYDNIRKHNDELVAENHELNLDIGGLNKLITEHHDETDNVGVGTVGSIDGESINETPALKADVGRPIEEHITQISVETINTGPMNSHQYNDWN